MGLDVQLLRESFSLVVEREPELTRRFYEVLFQKHPESRALFSRRSELEQQKMLRDMLVSVIEHLEDADWLGARLGALGEKHVGYGVTPEMYGWVGGSLLETLREVAADDWSPGMEAAWSDAYSAIAGLMRAGAQSASK
jgi:hemoglobin-like flavoprotein